MSNPSQHILKQDIKIRENARTIGDGRSGTGRMKLMEREPSKNYPEALMSVARRGLPDSSILQKHAIQCQ